MLKGKNIVVGVTGGIAAFKAASLVSGLVKLGANVDVIMTEHAAEFVSPLTFRSLAKTAVITDMFAEPAKMDIAHVSLAQKADIFVIAPATANIIGKIACGIADDMLSTTVMATKAPVLIVPAMNTNMYENPVVRDNIAKLNKLGYLFMEPGEGLLACGSSGKGRMPEPEDIIERIEREIGVEKDLSGLNILVTAGPTREAIDPVRYISNGSSGKMGYALAEAASKRGARVTLVSGPVSLHPPAGVNTVNVVSAEDMRGAVLANSAGCDIIIMAAAVGDFRPEKTEDEKIKKSSDFSQIRLVKNPDILAELGEKKAENQTIVGFCMETEDLITRAAEKLRRKNADMIVANNLKTPGAGFGVDTNVVTLIYSGGRESENLSGSKLWLADEILTRAAGLRNTDR